MVILTDGTIEAISTNFQKLFAVARSTYKETIQRSDAFSQVGTGADGLPTSLIDARLEQTCIELLTASRLVHTIHSEEIGTIELDTGGAFQAVLDPLDGTSNAAMRFPYCALSLAFEDEAGTAAALVANYDTGDVFTAFRSHGAFRNGKPIKVSGETELKRSRIVTSRPFSDEEAVLYGRLMTQAKRIRIVSSPALDIAHVACGSFSAHVDYHIPEGLIHRHDVVAAKLILEEAGGIMLDEAGASVQLPESLDATFNVIALNSRESFSWVRTCFNLASFGVEPL